MIIVTDEQTDKKYVICVTSLFWEIGRDQSWLKLYKYWVVYFCRYHYSDDMRRWNTNQSIIGIWLPRQVGAWILFILDPNLSRTQNTKNFSLGEGNNQLFPKIQPRGASGYSWELRGSLAWTWSCSHHGYHCDHSWTVLQQAPGLEIKHCDFIYMRLGEQSFNHLDAQPWRMDMINWQII